MHPNYITNKKPTLPELSISPTKNCTYIRKYSLSSRLKYLEKFD